MPEADEFALETPQIAPKRKPGRPRKQAAPAGPAASQHAESREDNFYSLLQSLPADQIVYIYALDPVRDNGLIGKDETNIDKLQVRELTRDYLRSMHGYGVYQAQVAGNGPKARLRMLDPDLQGERPRFDLRCIPDIPENRWWIELWTRRGYWPPERKKGNDEMSDAAIQGLTKTTEKLIDRQLAQNGSSDKVWEMMMEQNRSNQAMMLSLLQNGAGKGDPATTAVLELLKEQNRELREDLRDLKSREIQLLEERRATPAGEMTWPEAIAEVGRHAGPALAEIASKWQSTPPPSARAIGAAEPTTEPAQADTEKEDMTLVQKFQAVKYLNEAIKQFVQGGNGRDFAVYLVGVAGQGDIYGEIRAVPTAEAIQLITSRPEWNQAMAPMTPIQRDDYRKGLARWLDEFRNAYQPAAEVQQQQPSKKNPRRKKAA